LQEAGTDSVVPGAIQQHIEGENLHVHVVVSEGFATRISSEAVDYRYSQQQTGRPAELETMDLPSEFAEKCIYLGQRLSLSFAGIDLRISDDGRVFCFEVNPRPEFSYYQPHTGSRLPEQSQNIWLGLARSCTGAQTYNRHHALFASRCSLQRAHSA
jgi:hypothetical protein